jgi:hypothetical protein
VAGEGAQIGGEVAGAAEREDLLLHHVACFVHGAHHNCGEQRRLVGEVPVDRQLRHLGERRNLVHGRAGGALAQKDDRRR